jgi:hypothetical protein
MTDFSRRTFVTSVVGAIGAVGAAQALPAAAAVTPRVRNVEGYLLVAGVEGDSNAADYRNWIELTGWSWGTDGRDAAPFVFRTGNGRHTGALLAKAFAATPIATVTLKSVLTSGQGGEFLTLTFKSAVIAQATSESGGQNTEEVWSIPSFGQADLRMRSKNARGQFGPWEAMTWPST